MSLETTRELRVLADDGTFYEDLRWHDGRWYASDFYDHRVVVIDPDRGAETFLEIEQPSGLGWLPDGSLLAVSMLSRTIYRRSPEGEVSVHADLSQLFRAEANDMLVDAHGRAYVGSYGFDLMGGEFPAETEILRVDPDGTVSVAATGLRFPNGTVVPPDGRTMIIAETIAARLTAFTVQPDGSLTDRRVWAQLGPSPDLAPIGDMVAALDFSCDGITLDAEGCVWAADANNRRVARIAEGGEILEEIVAPGDLFFFGCMLGGDDGRTLGICSGPDWQLPLEEGARPSLIFSARVDVPHAGRP